MSSTLPIISTFRYIIHNLASMHNFLRFNIGLYICCFVRSKPNHTPPSHDSPLHRRCYRLTLQNIQQSSQADTFLNDSLASHARFFLYIQRLPILRQFLLVLEPSERPNQPYSSVDSAFHRCPKSVNLITILLIREIFLKEII